MIGRFLVSSWRLWEPQEEKIVDGVKLAIPEMEKEQFLVKTCFLVMQGSDTLSGCSNVD